MTGKKLIKQISLICALLFVISVRNGEAALKITFMEDLCRFRNEAIIDLRHLSSGILMFTPKETPEIFECTVNLVPKPGSSVVLSIYRYELGPEDKLMIEDSDHHTVALIGLGDFLDEKKSAISGGKMVIHYKMSNNSDIYRRQRLQFTFTQVTDSPCDFNEFQCKNGKCIERKLACDGHNHCGDLSDQQECVPSAFAYYYTSPPYVKVVSQIAMSSIFGVVACVLLLIIIIMLSVSLAWQTKKRKAQKAAFQAKAPPNSSNKPCEPQQTASFFGQIRRSFRRPQRAECAPTDLRRVAVEVPSMYPHVSSDVECSGNQNPAFQMRE